MSWTCPNMNEMTWNFFVASAKFFEDVSNITYRVDTLEFWQNDIWVFNIHFDLCYLTVHAGFWKVIPMNNE